MSDTTQGRLRRAAHDAREEWQKFPREVSSAIDSALHYSAIVQAARALLDEMTSWADVFQTRMDCYDTLLPLRKQLRSLLPAEENEDAV